MAASSHLKSMGFKSMPSLPFLGKRLNAITPGRSVAIPETMRGARNSTLREKMAESQKKFLQLPTFPSHEGSYLEGRSVNITVPAPTMSGARNSTLGEKMAHSQKKFSHLPTFPSHQGSYLDGREELLKEIRNAEPLVVVISPGIFVNTAGPDQRVRGALNSTTIVRKMAEGRTKLLQFPNFPSHEGSHSEGRRGFHKTTLGKFTCPKWSVLLLQVLRSSASNDLVESENSQVFVSFRGETRAGFTSHLHKELMQAGYSTFIDNLMKRGVDIDKELLKAIRNAKLSVIVISPGYASSQSCLDELVAILYERRFGHIVLPIFCHVDPDNVFSLKGNFGAAFDGLVENLEDETDSKIRVHCWKKALKEVCGISGLVLHEHMCESEFIDQIVAEVKQLLNPPPQRSASWPAFFYTCLHLLASYRNKD